MKIPLRGLFKNILHLGSGEFLGRLSNVAIVMLLGHRYGVVVLGVYALAQSVTQYLQPLIDFGLRHVGARLLALYPRAARDIVDRVQRRRLLDGWCGSAADPDLLRVRETARGDENLSLRLFGGGCALRHFSGLGGVGSGEAPSGGLCEIRRSPSASWRFLRSDDRKGSASSGMPLPAMPLGSFYKVRSSGCGGAGSRCVPYTARI